MEKDCQTEGKIGTLYKFISVLITSFLRSHHMIEEQGISRPKRELNLLHIDYNNIIMNQK